MKPERIAEIAMEVSNTVEWAEWEQWAELSLVEFATKLIARVLEEEKDAAVAKVVSSGEFDLPLLQWMSANHSFETPIGSKLFLHPQEEKE